MSETLECWRCGNIDESVKPFETLDHEMNATKKLFCETCVRELLSAMYIEKRKCKR